MLVRLLILCALAPLALAQVKPRRDSMEREYYIYTPQRIDASKTYWLVVGVHGYGGNGAGAGGISDWATKRTDCIVVGPSFPNDGYQLMQKESAEQLAKLFGELQAEYKLHPKMFLFGFSGGAQYAHRFMMKHPELVAGCSAHSAGSWATGDQWGEINPDAAGIALVISCGETDAQKMHPQAPYSRIEWTRLFDKQLKEKNFLYQSQFFPNVGHKATPAVDQMTLDCYTVATTFMPTAQKAHTDAENFIKQDKLKEAFELFSRHRGAAPPKTMTPLQKRAYAWHTERLDALSEKADTKGVEKVAAIAAMPSKLEATRQLRAIVLEYKAAPKTQKAAREALETLGVK